MSSGQAGGRNDERDEHWNRCHRVGNVLQQTSWKNGVRRGVATCWVSAACCTGAVAVSSDRDKLEESVLQQEGEKGSCVLHRQQNGSTFSIFG
jgi:hypothetical protein